jgi:hypothetical protein
VVGEVQEALLDALALGAAAGDGDVDPAVLLKRLEVGVDVDAGALVAGRVGGAEGGDAGVADAVLAPEVEVEADDERALEEPGDHEHRPWHGVARPVLLLPRLRRRDLADRVAHEPDCVHRHLFRVPRDRRGHPGERAHDGGVAAEFWSGWVR